MKKMMVILMVLVMVISTIGYATDDVDFTRTYVGRGTVTFNHKIHASLSNKCEQCHDLLNTYGGVTKDFGHKVCKTCHKTAGGNAPVTCTGCHIKEKE